MCSTFLRSVARFGTSRTAFVECSSPINIRFVLQNQCDLTRLHADWQLCHHYDVCRQQAHLDCIDSTSIVPETILRSFGLNDRNGLRCVVLCV